MASSMMRYPPHGRRVAIILANRRAAREVSSASTSSSTSGSFSPRAIRMLPLRIISVSKGGGGGGAAATDDLSAALVKRIQTFNRSVTEVKLKSNPRNRSDPVAIARDESMAVLASLNAAKGGAAGGANEFVVALDERGKALDAYGIARLLAKAGDDGHAGVSFIIGGAYGHDESVRQRATTVVSLSPLVLSHSIARVVLLEQLYRAYTQLANHPYHHV